MENLPATPAAAIILALVLAGYTGYGYIVVDIISDNASYNNHALMEMATHDQHSVLPTPIPQEPEQMTSPSSFLSSTG